MSLVSCLPRRLRARFTLIAIASAGVVFLCTAPLTIWLAHRLLVQDRIRSIEDRLDAIVSKGDSEMRAIRQQALALTDTVEQWEPANAEAWHDLLKAALTRLPKACGIRLAFEPDSGLGPEGTRSIFWRRFPDGSLQQQSIVYDLHDPQSPASFWYDPVRKNPTNFLDGVWSEPFRAPESAPERIITCTVPLNASEKGDMKFGGVAAMDVRLDAVVGILERLDLAAEFQAFVIGRDRVVSVAATVGGKLDQSALTAAVDADPAAFTGMRQLQNPANPDGWFEAKNPYTGEQSCFIYESLTHNPSQLVYVIPKRVLAADLPWLLAGVGVLGAGTIAGMGLLLRWSAGLVTRNLDVLRQGVGNVRAGNLREKLPPAVAHDETADVIEAFNGMVGELENAFHRTEELARRQQRIDTELELARNIQLSALPAPLRFPGGSIRGSTLPAQEVGGDFYDSFLLPGGRVALAVGDVSGKGVSAALFMVRSSLLLRSAAASMPPDEAVAQVNALLVKSNPELMFVTLFFAVWDPVGGWLECVNAGHNPPLLLRAGGTTESLAQRSGPALGAMSGHAYTVFRTPFHEGDLLAVYTDGISEAPDADGVQFGTAHLADLLAGHRTEHLKPVIDEAVSAVERWQGGGERFDDITLLLGRAGRKARRMELPASPDTIETVVEAVRSGCIEAGMEEQEAGRFALAACEAVTNIITHALAGDPSRSYLVILGASQNRFHLRFEDTGPPFDPEALPPVDLNAGLEARPVGGLGWVLIRRASDEIRMERVAGTNILTLVRTIQPANPSSTL